MKLSRRTLLGVAALAPLVACSGPQRWRTVPSPAEPITLAQVADGLVVGSAGPTLSGPAGPIKVTATTGYGRQARWTSLATAGERILGIGTTFGGAHSNNRWSVFSGTAAGLDEQPQAFAVFQGYGSGALVAATFAGDEALLVGSWQSETVGQDIALWRADGATWVRQNSTGSPLASSERTMVQATHACAGDRVLIVGQAIDLSPLATRAAAWVGTPDGGWSSVELPEQAGTSSADAAVRHADGWLVAGKVGTALAAWTISANLSARRLLLPYVAAGGPIRAAVGPDGTMLIATSADGRIQVLTGQHNAWRDTTVQAATVYALAWAARPTLIGGTQGQPNQRFELG